MTINCFFAATRNGNVSHFFGHILFDHHPGGVLIWLPTGVLDDVEVHRLYDLILLCGYDPVLCLLAVPCAKEIDWS